MLNCYFFTAGHFEKKQQEFVYLDLLGSSERLCDEKYMTFKQKQHMFKQVDKSIVDSVEFIVLESFQNELNVIKCLLEGAQEQNVSQFCPTILDGVFSSLYDKHVPQQEVVDYSAAIPVMLQTKEEYLDYINSLNLNADQRVAFDQVTEMVTGKRRLDKLRQLKADDEPLDYNLKPTQNTILIRGIFGSGKSQTLTMMISALRRITN